MQRAPFGCYASGRTPRLSAATPGGGLLSSAFLASMVRVHGEVGPGQQKANPDAGSSSVKATLWGARRPAAGVRPNAVRRGDAAQHERTSGRRLAPYLRAKRAQWGAENASSTHERPAKFANQSNTFTTADAFSGAERMRGWTPAKQKHPPRQPLRTERWRGWTLAQHTPPPARPQNECPMPR